MMNGPSCAQPVVSPYASMVAASSGWGQICGLGSARQSTTTITLAWGALRQLAEVSATGGPAVTYILYMDDGAGAGSLLEKYRGAASSATVSGLSGGTQYRFQVSAMLGSVGVEGRCSAITAVSTSSAAPLAPNSTHHTATSISLAWAPPVVASGAATTGYRVHEVMVTSPSEVLALRYDGAGSTATSTTLHGLDSGRLYTYRLSALSAAGEGDKSVTMTQSTAAPLGSDTSMSQQPHLPPRGVPVGPVAGVATDTVVWRSEKLGDVSCLASRDISDDECPPAVTICVDLRQQSSCQDDAELPHESSSELGRLACAWSDHALVVAQQPASAGLGQLRLRLIALVAELQGRGALRIVLICCGHHGSIAAAERLQAQNLASVPGVCAFATISAVGAMGMAMRC